MKETAIKKTVDEARAKLYQAFECADTAEAEIHDAYIRLQKVSDMLNDVDELIQSV